jgi:hypothetical protein
LDQEAISAGGGRRPVRHGQSVSGKKILQCDAIQESTDYFFKNIFVAKAPISPFNAQAMHIKSFYTQRHCYVSLKTLYPGGIRTRVFLFLRQMRCPLRHAARAERITYFSKLIGKS